MGCWNGTCALTHLPIRHGEKVRAFILIPSHFNFKPAEGVDFSGGGITYSTDAYYPLTLGLKGEYNDYGGVEKVKPSANTKAIVSWFNYLITEKKLTVFDPENFDKDKKPITKVKTIDEVLYIIERSGLRETGVPFGFIMVLDSAFQTSVKAIEECDTSWKRKGLLSDLKDISSLLKQRAKINKKKEKTKEDLSLLMSFRMLENAGFAGRLLYDFGDNKLIDEWFKWNFLNKELTKPTTHLYNDVIDHIFFGRAMQAVRRTWVSQCGNGSQDEDYNIHRKLAEFVIGHVAEKKKECIQEIDLDDPAERGLCNQLY